MSDEQAMPMCFNVQEFCTGGSIDNRLWGLPRDSVSDLERVQWACDCSEVGLWFSFKMRMCGVAGD